MAPGTKTDYHPLRWYDPILLATVPPLVGFTATALMRSCSPAKQP